MTDTIRTENVVASATLDQELDLEALGLDMEDADYRPDRFPGLIYRTESPSASSLVFRSGELLVTGASSEETARDTFENLFEEFRALGIEIPESLDVTVQNIVSTANLGTRVNLNAVAISLGLEHIEYEPEQFPGLVYRMEDPPVVTLLFGSGKAVITGATDLDAVEQAVEKLHTQLEEYGLLGL